MYYRYRKMYRLGFCMIHVSNFGNTSKCVNTLAPYLLFLLVILTVPNIVSGHLCYHLLCDYILAICFAQAAFTTSCDRKIRRMGVVYMIDIL